MWSKKLLLKQKEVVEAFASAFVSFPTSYSSTFAMDAFPQHRYIARKSFSELQIWLARNMFYA